MYLRNIELLLCDIYLEYSGYFQVFYIQFNKNKFIQIFCIYATGCYLI